MSQPCNHTSVGMLVEKDGKILLIERAREPFGFALPAGHVDEGESYDHAAIRELEEEVGLSAVGADLMIEGRKENPCRREGGTWHQWKIFRLSTKGELKRSTDETKRVGWYSIEEIKKLAQKTEGFRAGNVTTEEWEQSPGLEPVMYEWFKELRVI